MMRFLLMAIGLFLLAAVIYNFYPEKRLPAEVKIDKIIVSKKDRKMQVFSHTVLLKTYSVAIGKNSIGDKVYAGDLRTPEGAYTIESKNPNSGFHKNLGVSYPNATDIAHAKLIGKPPGGDVKIHGLKNRLGMIGKFHRFFNWTNGCIAVTNDEMDELYRSVSVGCKITIYP